MGRRDVPHCWCPYSSNLCHWQQKNNGARTRVHGSGESAGAAVGRETRNLVTLTDLSSSAERWRGITPHSPGKGRRVLSAKSRCDMGFSIVEEFGRFQC